MSGGPRLRYDFGSDPKVAGLWLDIQEDYLKQHSCKGASERERCLLRLDEETHTGCVDSKAYIPIRKFIPDTLTSCEVFERAYRFDRYHKYLVRHGFDLPPFVLDDFDPATTTDDRVRDEIYRAVDRIVEEMGSSGYRKGSREYSLELLKRIYDWGINTITIGFCGEELNAWQAYDRKCGACTQSSEIMYAALERAGFKPVIGAVIGTDPTIEEFGRKMNNPDIMKVEEHVCVAVPLGDEGGPVILDVARRAFGPKYTDFIEMTPREYLVNVYWNNKFIIARHQGDYAAVLDGAERCIRIAPDQLNCYLAKFGAVRRLWEEEDIKLFLDDILRRFDSYPMIFPLLPLLSLSHFIAQRDSSLRDIMRNIDRIIDAVEAISEYDKRMAARSAYFHVGDTLNSIAKDLSLERTEVVKGVPNIDLARFLREKALGIYGRAIDWDERFMANYTQYIATAGAIGDADSFKEAYDYFESYSKKRPASALGHYLAAYTGINYAMFLEPGDIGPVIERIEGHISELLRLKGDAVHIKLLRGGKAFVQRDYQLAASLMEKALESDPELFNPEVYEGLATCYVGMGRFDRLKDMYVRIMSRYGTAGKVAAMGQLLVSLQKMSNFKKSSSGESAKERAGHVSVDPEENHSILSTIEELIDMAADDPQVREIAQANYLLNATFLFASKRFEDAERNLAKAGRTASPFSQRAYAAFLGDFSNKFFISRSERFASGPDSGSFFSWLRSRIFPMLNEFGTTEAALASIAFAKNYILFGNKAGAATALDTAVGLNQDIAFKIYFERVVKELYSIAVERPEKDNFERAVLSLEICIDSKETFPKEVLGTIRQGLRWLKKVYPSGRLTELEKRLEGLLAE